MRKIKDWLYKRFLPRVTLDMYMADLRDLEAAFKAEKAANELLEARIEGMEEVLRHGRKIYINNEVNNGQNG